MFLRYRIWHVRNNGAHSLKHDLGDLVGSDAPSSSSYINWGTRLPRK
jgi:hypothetical protein